MFRGKKAREFFVKRAREAYEKVYDEKNRGYFFYNKISGTSQWTEPKILLGNALDPRVRTSRAVVNVD